MAVLPLLLARPAAGVVPGVAGVLSQESTAPLTYDSGSLGWRVPDDTDAGVAHVLDVDTAGLVERVEVSLTLSVPSGSTGWVGDLYVHLQHGSEVVVLMNRVGRTPTQPYGYGDSITLDLTFRDDAPQGDIHGYRVGLGGSEEAGVAGTVSGFWAPSGRSADPGLVLGTDPRVSLLQQFVGGPVAGGWALFVADVSGGGEYQVDRWGLSFGVTPSEALVPEPASLGVGMGGLLVLGLAAHTWARRRARVGGGVGTAGAGPAEAGGTAENEVPEKTPLT